MKNPTQIRLPLAFGVLHVLILASPLEAQVVVNPPQTLTHHVEVQPIRVKKTDGTTAAAFGTSSQETYIKDQINRVWAQLGVRIDWLPIADYTSNFAYDGSPANYVTNPRPEDDLDLMVTNSGAPPRSSRAVVVNMFFVEIVPGFNRELENVANGLSFVDDNGISVQCGSSLFGFQSGRDVIASVLAHEIGHALGLDHTAFGGDNLMSPGGTSERLTAAQKNIIFQNDGGIDGWDFLQPLSAGSNYSQWAAQRGVTGSPRDDQDRDGIPNVIEFMLNLNPTAFSVLPQPTAGPTGLTWTLTKVPGAVADGLVYQVQTSSNFQSWLNAGVAGSGSTIVLDSSTSLVVRLNAGSTRRVMRLDVNIPPNLVPPSGGQGLMADGPPAPHQISPPFSRSATP